MVKALSIFAGKYNHIVVYTCAAHTLHLITDDITKLKSAEDTVDTCTCIVKEINKSQILKASFTELQKEGGLICCLKIPVPARWGSILRCLIRLLKSKKYAGTRCKQRSDELKQTCKKFRSRWRYGLDLRKQKPRELVHPVVKLLFLLESEKTKISRVPQCFKELNDHFTSAVQETLWEERSTKLLWRVSVH
jgi:hypothetical protein